jgi:hypothetical protein
MNVWLKIRYKISASIHTTIHTMCLMRMSSHKYYSETLTTHWQHGYSDNTSSFVLTDRCYYNVQQNGACVLKVYVCDRLSPSPDRHVAENSMRPSEEVYNTSRCHGMFLTENSCSPIQKKCIGTCSSMPPRHREFKDSSAKSKHIKRDTCTKGCEPTSPTNSTDWYAESSSAGVGFYRWS